MQKYFTINNQKALPYMNLENNIQRGQMILGKYVQHINRTLVFRTINRTFHTIKFCLVTGKPIATTKMAFYLTCQE